MNIRRAAAMNDNPIFIKVGKNRFSGKINVKMKKMCQEIPRGYLRKRENVKVLTNK